MQNTKIQGQNNTAKEKFMSAPQVEMKELNNLFFELCYRACNLKCKHCYIEKNPYKQEKDFIPLDKIKNALNGYSNVIGTNKSRIDKFKC